MAVAQAVGRILVKLFAANQICRRLLSFLEPYGLIYKMGIEISLHYKTVHK